MIRVAGRRKWRGKRWRGTELGGRLLKLEDSSVDVLSAFDVSIIHQCWICQSCYWWCHREQITRKMIWIPFRLTLHAVKGLLMTSAATSQDIVCKALTWLASRQDSFGYVQSLGAHGRQVGGHPSWLVGSKWDGWTVHDQKVICVMT